ncbi:MAG TPA: ABC transporter substrate-binding protein [Clostridiales bacterium]|nr:ABC transporter substrate-binding protein [Clostridiales bacterium]
MKRCRKLLALAVVVALALTLAAAGCAKEPVAEEVTLTFWHTYNTDSNENKVLMETLIPAFEAKYPHIKIDAVVQPYDGLHDSLIAAVAGGMAPDLMRMDIIWVPEFAELGALEPLDDYPGFDELAESVFPGPLSTNLYKGKHYGMPLNTNTQVIVYNPEFLQAAGLSEPPATIEEFKAYAAEFTGQDGKYAFAPGGPYPWAMLPWFWSLGGRITNDDYTQASGYLDSDASVAALETMAQFTKDGCWAPTLLGGQPGTWDGFKAGNYGAVLEGPWFFAILQSELGDKMQGAPVPAGPGGSLSVVGGENIVIFESCRHKDAAWKFIQFMLSDEAQIAMAETGQMPVTFSASESDVMKEVGYYGPYIEQLKTALPRTPVPAWNKIDKILNDAFESVFRGVASAREALTQAAEEIDLLLGE